MSVTMADMLSIKTPNPNCCVSLQLKRASSTKLTPIALRGCRVSVVSRIGVTAAKPAVGFLSTDRRISWSSRSLVVSAVSNEDSKHSEIKVEKDSGDVKKQAEESEEAWKQTLESFKEQALKMQGVSKEAYEIYSAKAIVILKETSEKLKIQADRTRHDLSVLAKEINEDGKEYLSTAADNSPEEVKEILEVFTSSSDDLNDVSKFRDFHLGIPYGLFLAFGGFVSFMLTGSTAAIRFGVILGGALLALSVKSLQSYKKGETNGLALKGQAAIAAVIFLREICFLLKKASLPTLATVSVSGAMVAFYIYKVASVDKHSNEPGLKGDSDN